AFRIWRVHEAVCGRPDDVVYRLRGWGGSNRDAAEAESAAEMRLAWLKEKLLFTTTAMMPSALYEYGSGVIREEWMQLLAGTDDAPEAIVTRNRYGAPVLNARALAMIDIDLPQGGSRGLAFWKKPADPAEAAIAKVRAWHQNNPRASLRVYRTPNGFRVLRTDEEVLADSPAADRLLAELGNDKLYAALCKRQQCFRARLGPKPWRAALPLPPGSFPRQGEPQSRFEEWLALYEIASAGYAACRYLETIGEDAIAATLRRMVDFHDETSGALSDRPLA
ncbi:MAG: hypothetical protein ABIW30_00575, partial [Arenimonas sp.]